MPGRLSAAREQQTEDSVSDIDNEWLRHAERAGDILARVAALQRVELKPVEQAAEEFMRRRENFDQAKTLLRRGVYDHLYAYLRRKFPGRLFIELDALMKGLSAHSPGAGEEARLDQIEEALKKTERELVQTEKDYQPKLL